jgi:hypothetical protein
MEIRDMEGSGSGLIVGIMSAFSLEWPGKSIAGLLAGI